MTTNRPIKRTSKQLLQDHIRDFHRQPPSGMTYKELGAWHAGQHHRYGTTHYHAGVNLGPNQRPPGWRTGEDAVEGGARPDPRCPHGCGKLDDSGGDGQYICPRCGDEWDAETLRGGDR